LPVRFHCDRNSAFSGNPTGHRGFAARLACCQ
jgi:hypothetical protein